MSDYSTYRRSPTNTNLPPSPQQVSSSMTIQSPPLINVQAPPQSPLESTPPRRMSASPPQNQQNPMMSRLNSSPHQQNLVVTRVGDDQVLNRSELMNRIGGSTPPIGRPSPPVYRQNRCCDTGRPLFSDPLTGQTVCSCQYNELLASSAHFGAPGSAAGQQLGAPSGQVGHHPAAHGAPSGHHLAPPVYASPYGSTEAAAALAAYFPAYTTGLELAKDTVGGWPYPSVYHPYDTAFAGYPFNGYGMDLNGARRKNATRETTSTLKAWLNEHKKNPYPTKGEKIMLAIITKMTLTQVSTWFANARRRLKKENKMTWEPRNRVEDDDDDDDVIGGSNNNLDDVRDRDRTSNDGKDAMNSKDSGTASSEDGDNALSPSRLHDPTTAHSNHHHLLNHPLNSQLNQLNQLSKTPEPLEKSTSPKIDQKSESTIPNLAKPRIWSLADMASSNDQKTHQNVGPNLAYLHQKMAHYSPYVRPDLYRSFYGNSQQNLAILENYSRSLGACSSGNFGPLNLEQGPEVSPGSNSTHSSDRQ